MDYGLAVLAYLLGAIPFGLLLAKWWHGEDVREHGSGNIGFTNVLRVVGFKTGIVVLILDIGKGALSVWLAQQYAQHDFTPAICGLLTIVGHDWPVYLRFRGGKGVAATIGAFLVLNPPAALVALLILVASIATTRYVSLGSCLFVINLPVATLVLGVFGRRPPGFHAVWIVGVVIAAITLLKHRSNIQRLMDGTENQIGKKKQIPS